jgi:hypothetical protein
MNFRNITNQSEGDLRKKSNADELEGRDLVQVMLWCTQEIAET